MINLGTLNVRGMGSKWKQACFLHDLISHRINVAVITESKMKGPEAFSPLLNGYDKFISPSRRGGAGVAVLIKKNLDFQIRAVFLDPEGRLVVLDVTHESKQSFRLVAAYAPNGQRQSDFFRNLEYFLLTSKTIVLLGDFNTIL
uniref:exodeoxyribonuclease III n=1 Tax=Octopus bimaculoides TaxID=37653 RepID=A0A0L8H7G3_OCTBM